LEEEEEEEARLSRREERRRRLERVGLEVERWAADMLSDGDDGAADAASSGGTDDWREVSCNNFVRKKFNGNGRTRVYLKVRFRLGGGGFCIGGFRRRRFAPLPFHFVRVLFFRAIASSLTTTTCAR
jgi:hypothetical protein